MAIHGSSATYQCGDEKLYLIKKGAKKAVVCAQLCKHVPVKAVMDSRGDEDHNWITLDTDPCPVEPWSRHHYNLIRLPLGRSRAMSVAAEGVTRELEVSER